MDSIILCMLCWNKTVTNKTCSMYALLRCILQFYNRSDVEIRINALWQTRALLYEIKQEEGQVPIPADIGQPWTGRQYIAGLTQTNNHSYLISLSICSETDRPICITDVWGLSNVTHFNNHHFSPTPHTATSTCMFRLTLKFSHNRLSLFTHECAVQTD